MIEYRIGRRFIAHPSIEDEDGYYEYSIIEVHLEPDTEHPLYDEITQGLIFENGGALYDNQDIYAVKDLPLKIVNYSEANILSKWGNISELVVGYLQISQAFTKQIINLDNFPEEITNELIKNGKII